MKYEVTIREIEIYSLEVEAETDEEAQDKAWELLTEGDEKNKGQYHHDSDGSSEAYEIV